MTRYPRPQRRVLPRGVLEKVIQDFAPALLDDPSALSAIRYYVLSSNGQSACLRSLLVHLHERHGVLMAPELIDTFITCLEGAQKLVQYHHIQDIHELEDYMQAHKARMAEHIQRLVVGQK